ncbi:hypothetical protein SAMN03097708_03213 [Thiohalomonas denitrificans]|uniref:Uncharacterized protein n=1 Tax=Thiohalomonas denitrificans TaxID=415747 RepID=A0A1G5R215_9GAMM|nr:hypothetical protein SAMN03097708_03213 [Thiohalomonas denitrificans]
MILNCHRKLRLVRIYQDHGEVVGRGTEVARETESRLPPLLQVSRYVTEGACWTRFRNSYISCPDDQKRSGAISRGYIFDIVKESLGRPLKAPR